MKIFGNWPVELKIFLTRIHDPQISNQIDAAVAILLLISLWHHRRSCFLSIAEFLDLFYNFLCNYYLHYLILILCLLSGASIPPRPQAQIPPQSYRPSLFYGVRFSVHGETASAEVAMLRLPKARSPSRLGGLGSIVSSPAGSGAAPQKP